MNTDCDDGNSDDCCRHWWHEATIDLSTTDKGQMSIDNWFSTRAVDVAKGLRDTEAAVFECQYITTNDQEREIAQWIDQTQQYLMECRSPLMITIQIIPDRFWVDEDGNMISDSKAVCIQSEGVLIDEAPIAVQQQSFSCKDFGKETHLEALYMYIDSQG